MLRQYNPNEMLANWGGISPMMFAEGSMVNVQSAEDDVSLSVGAKGDVVIVGNFNPTGMVTWRLQAESPTNDLLSVRAATQKLSLRLGRPIIPYPMIVRSLNALIPHARAAFAVIQKVPELDKGDEAGVVEWVFLCADLDMYASGALL